MWNIFENSWLLLTVAGIFLVAASIYRQVKPEHGRKPLLVPLLLGLLGLGLDAGVRTDFEYIEYIVSSCKKAAIAADHKSIMRFISPNYSDSVHKSKTQLESRAEFILKAALVEKVRTQSHAISINGKTAESEYAAAVHLGQQNQYTAGVTLVFVGMKFNYEKIGRDWFIKRAEVVSVNLQPMNWGDVR